jgi:DNA (cytosine-5)-methyltransferase 1
VKVGSLFAGIGGFDLGFERAGFEVAWCVEWDKNAQAVLRKRFPNAQVYGDIREVDPDKLERVDVICGGFPCQDLSVAGKRAGLSGERSGLFHDAMRIVRRLRPSMLVLENVPGLLSSNRGLDFATVLREVGEGWDCAEVGWRVLDSQYFGVAQRRRRVFVVAGARAGCAEQILALAEGGGGDPPSRDKAREDASADAARCLAGTRESSVASALQTTANDYSRADGFNIVVGTIDCDIPKQRVQNFCAGHWIPCAIQGNLIGRDEGGPHGVGAREDGTMYTLTKTDRHAVAHAFYSTGGSHGVNKTSELSPPLKIGSALGIPSPPAVAFKVGNSSKARSDGLAVEQSPTLGSSAGGNTVPAVCASTIVRRLTPVECERLQGFPDGWTQIGNDKPTADTHRYKQLGNAVTVNVAEWIARRTMAWLT